GEDGRGADLGPDALDRTIEVSNIGHVSKISASTSDSQSTHHGDSSRSRRNGPSVQNRDPGERRPDRRIQRTRRTLHEALLALIRERGWDAVTVQDVCARADVGRSTFYVHFADKEELLLSGFAELRQSLRSHLADGRRKRLGFTFALLEHAEEHGPI